MANATNLLLAFVGLVIASVVVVVVAGLAATSGKPVGPTGADQTVTRTYVRVAALIPAAIVVAAIAEALF